MCKSQDVGGHTRDNAIAINVQALQETSGFGCSWQSKQAVFTDGHDVVLVPLHWGNRRESENSAAQLVSRSSQQHQQQQQQDLFVAGPDPAGPYMGSLSGYRVRDVALITGLAQPSPVLPTPFQEQPQQQEQQHEQQQQQQQHQQELTKTPPPKVQPTPKCLVLHGLTLHP